LKKESWLAVLKAQI